MSRLLEEKASEVMQSLQDADMFSYPNFDPMLVILIMEVIVALIELAKRWRRTPQDFFKRQRFGWLERLLIYNTVKKFIPGKQGNDVYNTLLTSVEGYKLSELETLFANI